MRRRESPFLAESVAHDPQGACLADPSSTPTQREAALAAIRRQADALESAAAADDQDRGPVEMKSCEDEDDTCCGRNQGSYYC